MCSGMWREKTRSFAAGSRAHDPSICAVCVFSSVVKNLQNFTLHCLSPWKGRDVSVSLSVSQLAYFKVSDKYLDKLVLVCDPNARDHKNISRANYKMQCCLCYDAFSWPALQSMNLQTFRNLSHLKRLIYMLRSSLVD